MVEKKRIPGRTVERLTQYRRVLEAEMTAKQPGREMVFSHDIARCCGCTAAQVRRDLMVIGHQGSTNRGYDRRALIRAINELMGRCGMQRLVLVGAGNLGTALLSHFVDRARMFATVAAFDTDPGKHDRLVSGVICHPLERLGEVVRREQVVVGVIAVPERAAQDVADLMIQAGIRGIVNFAPVPIRVPAGVVLETIDISGTLEKVAFFVSSGTTA
ncbi:MAG TPA: redox-sensing transcriptional repressor Rex [Polyangia bacterium]|nr:redox-sensing transcriptional repressor Rex [Polyangia bacterium]